MTNAEFGAIAVIIAAILCVMLVFETRMSKKHRFMPMLMLSCAMLIQWAACIALFHLDPHPERVRVWQLAKYVGISLTSVAHMIFTLRFIYPKMRLRVWMMLALFIIPACTSAIALTGDPNRWLYRVLDFVQLSPVVMVEKQYGWWFYVHTVYSYAAMLLPIALLLIHLRRISSIYRFPVYILLLGYIIPWIMNIAIVFLGLESRFDVTLIGFALGHSCFMMAVRIYTPSRWNIIAKQTVFEKMSCAALVLDDQRRILDINERAQELFCDLAPAIKGRRYEEVLDRWMERRKGERLIAEMGPLYHIQKDGANAYFSAEESMIRDDHDHPIGSFVEIRDVTVQHELLLSYISLASRDKLTGLLNRYEFDKSIESMRDPSKLPLSIISCDLNRLKHVNDTYGHAAGDRMLVTAAQQLEEAMPYGALIYRVGGDEFVVLLLNTEEASTRAAIEAVQSLNQSREDPEFGSIDLSMGHVVCRVQDRDLAEALAEADAIMYDMKRRSRAHRSEPGAELLEQLAQEGEA